MRKRLKKKICCAKCHSRKLIRTSDGKNKICLTCQLEEYKLMREVISDLCDQIPFFGVLKNLGWAL